MPLMYAVIALHSQLLLAHLMEAVTAALTEEHLHIGMTQQVILRRPLHNLDVAADGQAAIAQSNHIRLCQLPNDLGWSNCRKSFCNGLQLCCLCTTINSGSSYERNRASN